MQIGDGIITAFDSRMRRTTRYRADGTLIEVITTTQQRTGPAANYSLEALDRDEQGRLIHYWNGNSRVGDYQVSNASVLVHDADGTELFRIETEPVNQMYNFSSGGIQGGAGLSYSGSPVVMRLVDGRFIRSTGETPVIDLFSAGGEQIGRIEVDLPQEDTRAEEAILREYYTDRIRNAPSEQSRAFSQALLEDLRVPEFKAYWSGIEVDTYGYFWLTHAESYHGPGADNMRWRLLSPEGEYLGDTGFQAQEATISHGHLLTIQENEETGEKDLIVYEIRPQVRGLRYPH
jgi:hypothetical protein